MGNKEKILEMLKENELTVKDISQKLEISENAVNVYIVRLRKENRLKKIGKKERYNIYIAIENDPLVLLKVLYDIMINKVTPIAKLTEKEKEAVNRIEKILEI